MTAKYKDFAVPDEVRTFERGKLELLNFGNGIIGRLILEPGWRWSDHVKPIVKTALCDAPHFQYLISGKLHIQMVDGKEFEMGPGFVAWLPSGHDAWVVGNEKVVLIDWAGAIDYAKKQ